MREKWLIWCELNDEQNLLAKLFKKDCVSISGSTPTEKRIELLKKWKEEDVPILITKPKCFGYGLNFQNCHNMIFVGLSDSFESYYQAVRRCWRFGQTRDVNGYIIISAKEGAVKANIERKQADNERFKEELIELTKDITTRELKSTCRISTPYEPKTEIKLPNWEEFRNEQCA